MLKTKLGGRLINEMFRQDVIFGLRMLRKNPGFSLVAVFAMALGIGANATMFTIANGFLFRNLPFAGSERILYVVSVNQADGREGRISYPDYRDIRSRLKSFQSFGAFSRFDVDVSDHASVPSQYKGARLTSDAFSVIGQHPFLGRDFRPGDELPGAPPVAILSYSLWQSRYGGQASVLGSMVRINEIPTKVIGVMPRGMRFPGDSSLWIPLVPTDNWNRRDFRGLILFGRLARQTTQASATAEMNNTLASTLASQYPEADGGFGARVESFNDYFIGRNTRVVLLALLGAVGFVLLIACANVVNLLLARAALRGREMSVRVALGASRWRVIRQLMVESLMLSAAGGVLGTAMGMWGVRVFQRTLLPDERAAYLSFPIDWRVLAYLAAITVGAGVMAGLAPALRLSRLDINASLKEGGRGALAGSRGRRISAALIVLETALACVLLVGAGLMIRSFLKMARTPIGAETDHVMSMDILLRPAEYPTAQKEIAYYSQLLARLRALPAVMQIGMASNLPGDGWTDFYYQLEGRSPADPRHQPETGGVIISPSYFSLLHIQTMRGREFTPQDGPASIPVVVVNQSFAQQAWPNQNPIGKHLRIFERSSQAPFDSLLAKQPWLTVVGLVPDVVQNDVGQGLHDPLLYLPYRQLPQREMVVAARTLVPPETLANDFLRTARTLDPNMPVTDLRTLNRLLWERTWTWRVYGSMFSLFAAVALLLASVGLYSVIAHSISQRIPEIGVRMAMGAARADILKMVVAEGLRKTMWGLAAGLLASFALAGILRAMLVGVGPTDPATLLTVGLVLTLSGLLGSAVPALRAIRVDPAVVLRHE